MTHYAAVQHINQQSYLRYCCLINKHGWVLTIETDVQLLQTIAIYSSQEIVLDIFDLLCCTEAVSGWRI